MYEIVEQCAQKMKKQFYFLATAESCTGGWLGKTLTDMPGCSEWYAGGVISYSVASKMKLLKVNEQLIHTHSAVSPETAIAMAKGAIQAFGADLAIATTGIAGPGGDTTINPLGTVFIAITGVYGERVYKEVFSGNREAVRLGATLKALEHLHTYLST